MEVMHMIMPVVWKGHSVSVIIVLTHSHNHIALINSKEISSVFYTGCEQSLIFFLRRKKIKPTLKNLPVDIR